MIEKNTLSMIFFFFPWIFCHTCWNYFDIVVTVLFYQKGNWRLIKAKATLMAFSGGCNAIYVTLRMQSYAISLQRKKKTAKQIASACNKISLNWFWCKLHCSRLKSHQCSLNSLKIDIKCFLSSTKEADLEG